MGPEPVWRTRSQYPHRSADSSPRRTRRQALRRAHLVRNAISESACCGRTATRSARSCLGTAGHDHLGARHVWRSTTCWRAHSPRGPQHRAHRRRERAIQPHRERRERTGSIGATDRARTGPENPVCPGDGVHEIERRLARSGFRSQSVYRCAARGHASRRRIAGNACRGGRSAAVRCAGDGRHCGRGGYLECARWSLHRGGCRNIIGAGRLDIHRLSRTALAPRLGAAAVRGGRGSRRQYGVHHIRPAVRRWRL